MAIQSVDRRQEVIKTTSNFLATINANPTGNVRELSDSDLALQFDAISAEAAILPKESMTGCKGAILPMTISVFSPDINDTVSFVLLVNPESLNYGMSNATQLNYTRNGFISQLWGPNQMTLSATGRTAGFMTKSNGMSNSRQTTTIAYKNFMALLKAYKNNGYDYEDQLNQGNYKPTRVISIVRGVTLEYDGSTFTGHFNNFTLDNDAEHPFSMGYAFEFIVSSVQSRFRQVRGHFIPPTAPEELQPRLLSQLEE